MLYTNCNACRKMVTHSNYPLYRFFEDGRILSLYSGKYLRGSQTTTGYVCVTLFRDPSLGQAKRGKALYAHRVMWEAFRGPIPAKHVIHHLDEDKTHNAICNLAVMSYTEHRSCHPPGVKTVLLGHRHQQPCLRGDGHEEKWFPSIRAAARDSGVEEGNLSNCLRGGLRSLGGFTWQLAEPIARLESTTWACPRDPLLRHLEVSACGMLRNATSGVATHGVLKNGYYQVTVDRRNLGVHRIVCTVFHGHCPSSTHTVDHIDQNTQNNNARNLRWATPNEQSGNQKGNRAVAAMYIADGLTLTWPTIRAASMSSGIPHSTVRKWCNDGAVRAGTLWTLL